MGSSTFLRMPLTAINNYIRRFDGRGVLVVVGAAAGLGDAGLPSPCLLAGEGAATDCSWTRDSLCLSHQIMLELLVASEAALVFTSNGFWSPSCPDLIAKVSVFSYHTYIRSGNILQVVPRLNVTLQSGRRVHHLKNKNLRPGGNQSLLLTYILLVYLVALLKLFIADLFLQFRLYLNF